MAVLVAVGFFLKLFILYTLGWFLMVAAVGAIRGRGGIKMSAALVLGVFTAIFHLLVCSVYMGVCG